MEGGTTSATYIRSSRDPICAQRQSRLTKIQLPLSGSWAVNASGRGEGATDGDVVSSKTRRDVHCVLTLHW